MNKLTNYLKSIALFSLIFISYLLIISLLYYFELFSFKTASIINYIATILMFFVLGLKASRLEKRKGYLNGFLVSSILVIFFTLIALIISSLKFSSLVYYLTLIIASMIGGIVGVPNQKS